MKRVFTLVCFAVLASLVMPAYANFQTDGESKIGLKPLDVSLTDENGNNFKLSELSDLPLFIHPMFASCKATCPIMTNSLADSFFPIKGMGKDYRVLSLSFDPKETQEGLKKFRKTYGLPAEWLVARGGEKEVRALMDSLNFKYVQTAPNDFAHSNTLILLNTNFVIHDYLYGAILSTDQIRTSLEKLESEPQKESFDFLKVLAIAFIGFSIILLLFTTGIFRR